MHLTRYVVEIWAGSGSARWNPQAISVMASSARQAQEIVADELHLKLEHWQGDDPPLELVALAVAQQEAVREPRFVPPAGRSWFTGLGAPPVRTPANAWSWAIE
jgi:hypothetical protein